jgi:hypothetical protein
LEEACDQGLPLPTLPLDQLYLAIDNTPATKKRR